jgi:hypothetical protein
MAQQAIVVGLMLLPRGQLGLTLDTGNQTLNDPLHSVQFATFSSSAAVDKISSATSETLQPSSTAANNVCVTSTAGCLFFPCGRKECNESDSE